MGPAMKLVDLIVHGGDTGEDGKLGPLVTQAATQMAREWLSSAASRWGKLVDDALIIERYDEVVEFFLEMPEEFCVL